MKGEKVITQGCFCKPPKQPPNVSHNDIQELVFSILHSEFTADEKSLIHSHQILFTAL